MRVLLDFRPTYQWLAVVAIGFVLVTGCGDKGVDKPLPKAKDGLSVRLPWAANARIPARYTCDGAEAVPLVRIAGASPPRVAIVMTDPDAPGGGFTHWTRWGTGTEGRNSFGKVGYSGPCPPHGDKPHHYVVTAYELRSQLGLQRGANVDRVLARIRRLAVASGSETGVYGR